MAQSKDNVIVRCSLCRKDKESPRTTYSAIGIHSWVEERVCPECRKYWELGKKAEKSDKSDGKIITARVILKVDLTGNAGNPQTEVEIRSTDIIAAMGGVKLRGTEFGNKWHGIKALVHIGEAEVGNDAPYLGSDERTMVPQARAEAMKKIIGAFYNAVAKARVEGFQAGRNLLAGLASGDVKVEDYSVQADNTAAGKRPKSRWK